MLACYSWTHLFLAVVSGVGTLIWDEKQLETKTPEMLRVARKAGTQKHGNRKIGHLDAIGFLDVCTVRLG